MTSERKHALIREVEVAGCTVEATEVRGMFRVRILTGHGVTVAHSLCSTRFDIEEAYRQWRAWRDAGSLTYRARSVVRPQEALRRSRRVVSHSGAAAPHVAKTVAQDVADQQGAA